MSTNAKVNWVKRPKKAKLDNDVTQNQKSSPIIFRTYNNFPWETKFKVRR